MPKKERTYANFGEYLFWSYANLQMLFVALKEGKPRYDRLCFMIRAKAFKAYKDGRWNIIIKVDKRPCVSKEQGWCQRDRQYHHGLQVVQFLQGEHGFVSMVLHHQRMLATG